MKASPRVLAIVWSVLWLASMAQSSCNTGPTRTYAGVFYANDCGVSHGGFEWAGEYNARLELSGEKGTLELFFSVGLGDPLERHRFSVRNFAEATGAGILTFTLEGRPSELRLVDEDLIWNGHFDGYYAGLKSDEPSEQIGRLPIEVFEGFRPHYYIDLRLKPGQEKPHLFFSHR